jgi:hypothetical protein
MCAMSQEVTPKPREAIYVSRNIEVRTLYHCCRAEGKSIKLRMVSVFLSSVFQHANHIFSTPHLYCHLCRVWFYHIFSTLSNKQQDFRKSVTEHK